jgi:probable phosphoglycerate mutase
MLLYLIRHGDPDYTTDTLTDKGLEQAEAVAERLKNVGIDTIYASSMGRAMQTAEPLCKRLGIPCISQDWARELSDAMLSTYPDGKQKVLAAVPPACFWEEDSLELNYRQGVLSPPVRSTTMALELPLLERNINVFLEQFGYKKEGAVFRITENNQQRVALFCHAGVIRAICSILLHIPVHTMWSSFDHGHTGVTVLEFRDYGTGLVSPKCLCFSDMSHLQAHSLDMRYNNRILI